MASELRLTHVTALILQAIDAGFVYGFSIMDMTGLPSGTVYPAMRRMEEDDKLIRSRWERQAIADREHRPPRKYYQLTAVGRDALATSRKRYPLIERLIPSAEAKSV
jgi:PadR family transcriptional regulator PadR